MSIMAMEFDGKPLIREIKKRPLLYEKSAKDYANLVKRRRAWVEICQALIKDWDTWDAAEQERAILQANKRWHNMRNCFQRELKMQITEELSKRRSRRKYFYYDDMLFLIGKSSDDGEKTDVDQVNDEIDKSSEEEEVEESLDDTGFRKLKFKNYFATDLIKAVKNAPMLYDKSLTNGNDEGSKSEAWKRVAAAVYPSSYCHWKRKERDAAVKYLKLRWSNIRTCFLRELKAQIADPNKKLRREYMYSKHLKFLKPHMDVGIRDGRRSGKESAKDREQEDSGGSRDDQKIEYLEDFHYSENEHDEEDEVIEKIIEPSKRCYNDTSGTETSKKIKLDQTEVEIVDPLLSHDLKSEKIDPDVNFALSLVPMLKKLSTTKKLEAQIQILNIFKKNSNKST